MLVNRRRFPRVRDNNDEPMVRTDSFRVRPDLQRIDVQQGILQKWTEPPMPGDTFPKFVNRIETMKMRFLQSGRVSRDELLAMCFDKFYNKPVDLNDYASFDTDKEPKHWYCLAYSDAWFQAFGYDAMADYTVTQKDDIDNNKHSLAMNDKDVQRLTSARYVNMIASRENFLPSADVHNIDPSHRLHFDVKNSQKLFLFGTPVSARARAETLNPANTRIKVDFGFGAPARGNYLIIGYEPNMYAVVGDFDRKYLWFLVRQWSKTTWHPESRMVQILKDHARVFGYSDEFLNNMNYRIDSRGRYLKYFRTWRFKPEVVQDKETPRVF